MHVIAALNLIKKCEEDVKKNIEQEEDFKKLLEIEKRLIGDEEEHFISPHRVSDGVHACNTLT